MACDRYVQMLSARLDGLLSGEEDRELEEHLARCPGCRALWKELEQLRQGFGELPEVPAPQGFAQGVMDRIRAEKKPKVIPLFKRPQVRALVGLAACLVLVVGLYGASQPRHLDRTEKIDMTARSFSKDALAEGAGVVTSDAPMIAAYAAPEDGQEPFVCASGPAQLMLDRMPEGAAELIGPETAVSPTEDGEIYFGLSRELIDQIAALAEEQGINSARTSMPQGQEDGQLYDLVILDAKR